MNRDGRKRILLAEDTAVGRKVIAHSLANAGFEVTSVGDGQAVLDSLSGMPYDLVVMDCMMPVMDGFEATRAIRRGDAGEEQRGIPVVAITGLGSDEDKEKCRDAGMDDVLQKPVEHDVLIACIERLLSRREDAEQEQAHTRRAEQQELMQSLDEWSPGFLDSIIDQFLEDVPGEIESLKAAIAGQDLNAMREIAHRLRGSADVVSAASLSRRARALEQACAAENVALARQLAPALVLELENVGSELGEG